MDGCMDEWITWLDGWIDVWKDGWMDGWINIFSYPATTCVYSLQ